MNKNLTMITIFLISVLSLLPGCSESEVNDPEDEQNPACEQLFPPEDAVIRTHTSFTKTHYPERIETFKMDTITAGDIVMLGNSLTEQGGDWNVKLDQSNVKNRGISGDNTDGVMARLNELICRKPSVVFLMIGTNDLFTGYNAQKISQNIDSIGSKLVTSIPEARIIVQTIMPLGAGNDKKAKLIEINDLLRSMTDRPYELIETYQHMANETGDLPAAYTYDGVHLTSVGYDHWVTLLKNTISSEK